MGQEMFLRKIPEDMRPWECNVNGVKYVYPAGTEQNVPAEVAAIIDAYWEKQKADYPETGISFNDLRDRPFGESTEVLFDQRVELGEVTVLSSASFEQGSSHTNANGKKVYKTVVDIAFGVTIGNTYTVAWDGVEYFGKVNAYDSDGSYWLGDVSLKNPTWGSSGDPFCFYYDASAQTYTVYAYEGDHSYKIQQVKFEVPFAGALDVAAGDHVVVTWDGVVYECDAEASGNAVAFGNLSLIGGPTSNDEPFVILIVNETNASIAFPVDEQRSHSIKIEKMMVHTLDPKFLPELVVNITLGDDDTFTADKTIGQIFAACKAGINCVAVLNYGNAFGYCPCTYCEEGYAEFISVAADGYLNGVVLEGETVTYVEVGLTLRES